VEDGARDEEAEEIAAASKGQRMSDGRRTTKVVALMAANGFAFVQVYNRASLLLDKLEPVDWTYTVLAVVTFAGAAAAFATLYFERENWWTTRLEFLSQFTLWVTFCFWVGFLQGASDATTQPHAKHLADKAPLAAAKE
jgi:hypothetical protein